MLYVCFSGLVPAGRMLRRVRATVDDDIGLWFREVSGVWPNHFYTACNALYGAIPVRAAYGDTLSLLKSYRVYLQLASALATALAHHAMSLGEPELLRFILSKRYRFAWRGTRLSEYSITFGTRRVVSIAVAHFMPRYGLAGLANTGARLLLEDGADAETIARLYHMLTHLNTMRKDDSTAVSVKSLDAGIWEEFLRECPLQKSACVKVAVLRALLETDRGRVPEDVRRVYSEVLGVRF